MTFEVMAKSTIKLLQSSEPDSYFCTHGIDQAVAGQRGEGGGPAEGWDEAVLQHVLNLTGQQVSCTT